MSRHFFSKIFTNLEKLGKFLSQMKIFGNFKKENALLKDIWELLTDETGELGDYNKENLKQDL